MAHGDTRTLIKRRALEQFLLRGIDRTTVRDIAKLVGMEGSNLYAHFESKGALVRNVVSDLHREYGTFVREVLDQPAPFLDRLPVLVDRVCQLHDANTARFRFALSTRHSIEVALAPCNNPVEIVSREIAKAIAEGEIDPADPRLLTGAMLGALEEATFGTAVWVALQPRSAELTLLCRRLVPPRQPAESLPGIQ